MNKRPVSLWVGGLILSLGLMVCGSLAQAQEPFFQKNADDVHISSLPGYVERRERVELLIRLAVSHTMRVEPVRLQINEQASFEAQMVSIESLLPEVQLTERHHPVRREIKASTRQATDKASSVTEPIPIRHSVSQVTRPAADCVVVSPVDSGSGTLRQCLDNAVAGDVITFDANAFPPTNPTAISLVNTLPLITTDDLTIDGSNAGVILDGSGLSSGYGLVVWGADGVNIQGLQILHFPQHGVVIGDGATNTTVGGDRSIGNEPLGQGNLISGNGGVGVWLQNTGTMNNTVLGNYIGTNISGTAMLGNSGHGVFIGFGSSNNIIGGDTPDARNLISGNGGEGVQIQNSGTTVNQVAGNLIGTNIYGTASLGNAGSGVTILVGATNNIIGGDTLEARNTISGNRGDAGVEIAGSGATGNVVLGNFIGTNISGTAPLANIEHGVVIYDGATNNVVGGTTPGARNLISGNGEIGVVIAYAGASGNQVLGNCIGTDGLGTALIPNYRGVIIFNGPTDNMIGGDSLDARNLIIGNTEAGVRIEGNGTTDNTIAHNVISGNGEDGVVIRNTTQNQVLGNYIGTDPTGTTPLGNLRSGVVLDGASNNVIGGATSGAGNLISGNELVGIHLQGFGTTDNQIRGNFIGTNVSGTVAVGNLGDGILITSEASDNIVGGDRFIGDGPMGQGNLISGNEEWGIMLEGTGTTVNQIQGNFIGTDVSGTAAIGNLQGGIFIVAEASNNIVGGNTSSVRNLISGNVFDGIRLQNPETTGNQIQGNFIGTDISGEVPLGNLQVGVAILGGASNNLIGGSTAGVGNLVSGNELAGVYLGYSGTISNQVQGNFIGTNFSGTAAIGNLGDGIILIDGASNNFIGGDRSVGSGLLGQGNLVSGNEACGITLEDADTTGNQIQGNFVGTNISGTAALGNLSHGIVVSFGSSDNVIGGNTPDVRNLVSGNEEGGVWLQNSNTAGNQVQGNFIGTDISGTAALGNHLGGVVLVYGASNNLVGGTLPGQGNLISGNGYPGVILMAYGFETRDNRVQGNLIGTDVSGVAALGNYLNGISIIDGASDNLVGGTTITAGNTIAFHSSDGIYIDGNQTLRNTISHNSIHDNGGLGIENVNGGDRELDPPTITEIVSTSVFGQTQSGYIVEVFSDNDDEGQWFEGSVTANGNGAFTVTQPSGFRGPNLMATATDAAGNTSEFSNIYTLAGDTLTPISTTVVALCDRTIVHTHTLTNIGAQTDTFTLSATSDRGWLEGYQPSQVTLGSGMTATVIVTVTGPSGIVGKEVDRTVITATSVLNPQVLAVAEDTSIFDKPSQIGGTMIPSFNTVTVTSSETVVYTHTLVNNGLCTDAFTLSVTSSQGWLEAYWPQTVTLDSGMAATVNVTVTVSDVSTVKVEDRTIITATSGLNPQAIVTAEDITIFEPSCQPSSTLSPASITTTITSSVTIVYTHTLVNNGLCTDAFTLSVTSSQGWLEAYWPQTVTLDSGMAATVNVTVTVSDVSTVKVEDRTIITATSGLNPQVVVTAEDITIFEPPLPPKWLVYLPLVVKNQSNSDVNRQGR